MEANRRKKPQLEKVIAPLLSIALQKLVMSQKMPNSYDLYS